MEADQTNNLPANTLKNTAGTLLMLAILIAFIVTIALLLWIGTLFYGVKELAQNCSTTTTVIGVNNLTTAIRSFNATGSVR